MGQGSVGLMEFDHEVASLRLLNAAAPLYFVVADLQSSKDTVEILDRLNQCFPVPLDSTQVGVQTLSIHASFYSLL